MKRYGQVIMVEKGKMDEVKNLYANMWPRISEIISKCNMKNYTVYFKDDYMFCYYEYTGNDYDKDMQKMADDTMMRKWWSVSKPHQVPLETRKRGEWWADMEEVYHQD